MPRRSDPQKSPAAEYVAAPGHGREPLVHLVEGHHLRSRPLTALLEQAGFRVRVFAPGAGLDHGDDDEGDGPVAPDVLVMAADPSSLALDDGTLKAHLGAARQRDIAVVAVTADPDPQARLLGLRAGITRYLSVPLDAGRLIEVLDDLTHRQPARPYRVVLVDPDGALLEAQAAVLRDAGMAVHTVSAALEALDAVAAFAPDVVVMAVSMDEASGPELSALLRDSSNGRHVAVLFLAGSASELAGPGLGGDDCMLKPVSPPQLVAAVKVRAHRARNSDTIRRRLEDTLYERDREHLALDHHALVSIADARGDIIYANDRFCRVSGYPRHELLGRNHRIIKSGIHPPEFYQDLWRTIARGGIWQGDICNRRKDGGLYWVNSTITPFLDERGRPYQYVSIRTDVSALKAAEDELVRAYGLLESSNEAARIGTWEMHVDPPRMAWSRMTRHIHEVEEGWECDPDQALAFCVPGTSRDTLQRAFHDARFHAVSFDEEIEITTARGNRRWVRAIGLPELADGRCRRIYGLCQDITPAKDAERELSKLSRIARDTTNGVVVTDADGRVEWINRGFTRISGYGLEELRGRRPGRVLQGEATDPATVGHMHQALARHQPFQVDVVNYTRSGLPYWIHIDCNPLRDDAGEIQGFMAIQSDITEQVHARQALITARDEAERANRAKSEFLSRMSHELRTPMNAILGFGQLMEYAPGLPADHRDNLREILKAGHHLLELINEVLDLSRIESGHLDLSLEAVEMSPLVDEALSLVASLAQTHGIRLHRDGLADVVVRAHRVRLKQVLLNLLSNAVKYNRPGGRVELTVRPVDDDRLRIGVTDSGKGIPSHRLAELFEPFRRLDAEHSTIEGTGIGLTITRRIVELMGGSVGVESEVGVGSTFWIELPRDHPPEAADDGASAVAAGGGHEPGDNEDSATHSVLYIEDNPANLKMVARIIGRRRDIRLHTAHLPELGIRLAADHRPDLILLDINMPGMDGYGVLEVLKSKAELSHIPVVAISANAMPRDIRRAEAAGFSEYLTKPLEVARFHEVLDRFLRPAGPYP